MILSMWPVSAVIMVIITLSMAELASAFPVAGAMASWAWKCARGGVRGERYWGWAINGITMGFHIAVVRDPISQKTLVRKVAHRRFLSFADEPHHRSNIRPPGKYPGAGSPKLHAGELA